MQAQLYAEYQICPVAKPRQTRSDVWKERPCVMRYRSFADECRASGMEIPEAGAHIIFIIPMSKSWSKKKKKVMDGQPHQQQKDVDNLLKAILDSIYENDACVWDIRVTKLWGRNGKIIIKQDE